MLVPRRHACRFSRSACTGASSPIKAASTGRHLARQARPPGSRVWTATKIGMVPKGPSAVLACVSADGKIARRRSTRRPFARLVFYAALLAPLSVPFAEAGVDFSLDIRPLLAEQCFRCHGPDEGTRASGLRLDVYSGAIQERDGIRAVTPGSPETSELIARVRADNPARRMPLGGDPLSEQQIRLLEEWISEGAEYQRHWAYEAPTRPQLHGVSNSGWPRNPIDHFVLSKLDAAGLKPSLEAEPAILMRRLYLDLTGIAPSPEQIDDFLADPTDDGYRAKVEELLASPRYGEHWARHWLDLARYADSNGYQHDDLREIWPYRDWVIRAFNDDLPFDRFTEEQLAGDLLDDPTLGQLVATGFNRNTPMNGSGGSKLDEVRNAMLVDRVNTTATVWLGSTLGCAQCHTHKYDPFTIEDYYRLYAYFDRGVDEVVLRGDGNTRKYYVGAQIELPVTPGRRLRYSAVKAQHEHLRMVINQAEFEAMADFEEWVERQAPNQDNALRPVVASALAKPAELRTESDVNAIRDAFLESRPTIVERRKELEGLAGRMKRLAPPTTLIMADRPGPVQSHVLERGQIGARGAAVEPGLPAALHASAPGLPANRLGLARWITAPENPLTARVTVNRIWAEIFGRGIVASAEDFGRQGDAPTHPDLLDWLAVEFVDRGWSIKHLVRLIANSATYRQSSRGSSEKLEQDPDNQLMAIGPRFRLPAEAIRDSLMAAGGLLSFKMGGPPVHPPQPEGLWKEISGVAEPKYPTSSGVDRHRRGIFTVLRRGAPYPSFTTFDASPRAACAVMRARTNSPLQALTLLNDPVFVEAADALAKLAMRSSLPSDSDRLVYAFRRAVTRAPTEAELEELVRLMGRFRHASQSEFEAWASLARVLLNLDEAITKS